MQAPPPISILLADDHQMIIDGIKSLLATEEKYRIIADVNNGQNALNYISQHPNNIQIVLSDISMPLMSGTELCRNIKSKYPHIKVLMLSMYNNNTVVKEAIAAEADGYILKNTGKEELLTALHRISENSTYFSQDILPILYRQYQKEKKQEQEVSPLSAREKEILKLIVQELTSEEIAQKLFISKKTVDTHRAHMLEKSNTKSTVGLVKFAVKHGIIEL